MSLVNRLISVLEYLPSFGYNGYDHGEKNLLQLRENVGDRCMFPYARTTQKVTKMKRETDLNLAHTHTHTHTHIRTHTPHNLWQDTHTRK